MCQGAVRSLFNRFEKFQCAKLPAYWRGLLFTDLPGKKTHSRKYVVANSALECRRGIPEPPIDPEDSLSTSPLATNATRNGC
jgi:hypothetical protein